MTSRPDLPSSDSSRSASRRARSLVTAARTASAGSLLRSAIALPLLLVVQLSLQLTNVARTRGWLLSDVPEGGSVDAVSAREVAKSVTRVARRRPLTWVGVDCLAESLVIESWLERRGFATELRIGISLTNRSDAHAWVAVGGVPVNEASDISQRMSAFAQPLPRPDR